MSGLESFLFLGICIDFPFPGRKRILLNQSPKNIIAYRQVLITVTSKKLIAQMMDEWSMQSYHRLSSKPDSAHLFSLACIWT
jgi:hypothetical protein